MTVIIQLILGIGAVIAAVGGLLTQRRATVRIHANKVARPASVRIERPGATTEIMPEATSDQVKTETSTAAEWVGGSRVARL